MGRRTIPVTKKSLVAVTACSVLACLSAGPPASATTVVYHEASENTFVVPPGVTSLHVIAVGGQGAPETPERHGPTGGYGAEVTGTLAVTPGQKLYVVVGETGGRNSGGFNGGGNSATNGGGGASDIRTGPRSAGLTPDDRLIVAGGGGGAGGEGDGGNAERPGRDGEQSGPYEPQGGFPPLEEEILGGVPGTQEAGGAGGAGCEFYGAGSDDGEPGQLGQGGWGGGHGHQGFEGGGGDGGYFGGGGGGGACVVEDDEGLSAGGGGGSSLIPDGGELRLSTNEPQVDISYPSAPVVTAVTPAKGPPAGGTSVTITGEDFTGATSVSFGSTKATTWKVDSDSTITAVSPGGKGKVAVAVINPVGTNSAHPWSEFTYKAEKPTITSVEPNHGSTTGGTVVTVKGTGFALGTATSFEFGSINAASANCSTSTSCTVTAPPAKKNKPGTVDVVATVEKAKSNKTAADRYTYTQ